ncbi:hypothetical protein GHK48_18530 [Sinorhizobium fredii]|uniref:Uncharacterized protein n=1 Tax=Rhizobium fredii TaxID=380 RepID=A0A844ACG3_RHIFR|nr:hypothetical protein [Sinorhizobium fredii]MQX10207.1 hypothetical protein [Sinorhizobium fredii]
MFQADFFTGAHWLGRSVRREHDSKYHRERDMRSGLQETASRAHLRA